MSRSVFAWGNRRLIAYLAFLSAFAPLSTDMYLPALPHMAEALNTTYSLTSLTVSGFLLLFALSMLAWGPLSDKYGRSCSPAACSMSCPAWVSPWPVPSAPCCSGAASRP